MKSRPPAFQFYAGDYLADSKVMLLTLEEEGCYIRLLASCWIEGSIPADPAQLSKLCKRCSTEITTSVARLFEQNPNDATQLIHKRLEEEREKQKEYREQQSKAGKRSAEIRSQKQTVHAPLEPPLNGNPSLQSSSSSTNQLTGVDLGEDNSLGKESPSVNSSFITTSDGAAPTGPVAAPQWPEIVQVIYRYFPIHVQDQKSLEAIQDALKSVDAETLMTAVKAYANEVARTNTQRPMWATKWFPQQLWKSYLPVVEQPSGTAIGSPPLDDQNLSSYDASFYENLNPK